MRVKSYCGALLFAAFLVASCADPAPKPPQKDLPPEPPPATPAPPKLVTDSATGPPTEAPPTSVWEAARQAGVDFRGVGNEPGWLLEIRDGESLVLVTDYGETRHVFPAPHADAATTDYDLEAGGHRLRVTLDARPCADTMSDETFPTTVTVRLDAQTLHGCGRALR